MQIFYYNFGIRVSYILYIYTYVHIFKYIVKNSTIIRQFSKIRPLFSKIQPLFIYQISIYNTFSKIRPITERENKFFAGIFKFCI